MSLRKSSGTLPDIAEVRSLNGSNSADGSRDSDDDVPLVTTPRSRQPRTFVRQGSSSGNLFQRTNTGNLSSPLTMNRISNVSCIETGLDTSGKEHHAQVRRDSDCRPMGKVVRRNQHFKRFMNATKNLLHVENVMNVSRNCDTNTSNAPDESESVRLSQHGRLSVRAATRTVSVPDSVIPEEEDISEDKSGRNYDAEAEPAAMRMGATTTVPLKGGPRIRRKKEPTPQSYRLETTTQYRLNGTKPNNTMASRVLGLIGIATSDRGIYDDAGSDDDGCSCWGINPNNLVTSYLHWTFRNSFLAVFFSTAVGFFSFTIIFAWLIFWSGRNRPECLHINGINFSNYTTATLHRDFGDAYALSWTTFSTVGYGLVYPSMSAVHGQQPDCAVISMLCTLESFVGILFASFTGAVVFAKVGRIRSHAQVMFSDAIVIRYGSGVLAELKEKRNGSQSSGSCEMDIEDGGEDEAVSRLVDHNEYPCPVLEFRIANRLHATNGGEIMDCSMNIVASIDENQASHTVWKATNTARRRKKKRIRGKASRKSTGLDSVNEHGSSEGATSESLSSLALHLREHAKDHNHQAFEEDISGMIVPKRIFSKLEVETGEHPFFKRVWTARHTMNLESPILAEEAKQMIRLNRGFWPNELNDPESVRASINLDQVLVSLSGTSNADANSVYSQKIYDHHDMNIGYRFVNMMYRDPRDGSLKVDTSVINDVVEQAGGGGEPLHVEDMGDFGEILVL